MEMATGNIVVLLLFAVIAIAAVGICDTNSSAVDKYVSHLSDYSLLHGKSNYSINNSTLLPNSLHLSSPVEYHYYNSSDNGNGIWRSRRSRRDTKKSLCDTVCDCQKDAYNKFIRVYCDLKGKELEQIFGDKYEVPYTATSIVIKLASRTSLRLEEGLFSNNKINRLYIEGVSSNSEQLEIGTNAFKGNEKAPFPDIEIVNCHSVVLRTKAFRDEFKLTIQNCNDVIIYPDTFFNASFEGKFHNIADLRIQEQSFNSSRATLDIASSTIETLYRFDASLREIRFFNCSIGTIGRGTFDVLTINSIIFEQCKIDVVKTRAITEKLLSPHLAITGAIIGIIESEAIAGSGISELILAKNEIDTIQENAIYVTTINATITQNRIKHLGYGWLRVKEWSNITISKNQFGDLGLIILDKAAKLVACMFDGNFITNPKSGSLNITNPSCIIRETSFFQRCTCNMTWLEELSSRDLKSESYCTIDDSLKFCFNASIFNVLKYKNEVCDYSKKQLDCLKNINLKKIQGDFLKPEELENKSKHTKLIYILVGIGVLAILVIIAFIIAIKVIKRKPATIPISDVSLPPTVNGTTLKELKTFSNDDRRIINQTLDTMKQKYPPDVFEQVHNNTQILLRGNITEMERVKTIGDIVQILGECQNPGDDFVAFTDILYRHLAPTGGGINPDPVYAEPTLPETDIGNDDNTSLGDGGLTNIDHIYAEPFSAQQPLLTNEYSSPADRNEPVDLYSEPITNDKDRKIIPPYAVISPREQHHNDNIATSHHQPSTSKNLPDVLNPSKPMTNVQKLAQNFANNPNFHITRSPNTNRKIPKYTIPDRTKIDKNPDRVDSPIGKAGNSSSDNRSDHSGGSDITVKMDDIIEYADA